MLNGPVQVASDAITSPVPAPFTYAMPPVPANVVVPPVNVVPLLDVKVAEVGTLKLPLIVALSSVPPEELNVSAVPFTVPPVIVPPKRVKIPPPSGAFRTALALFRLPVKLSVPAVPLIVPLVRFDVENTPPRSTVPPLAARIVPVFVQVVAPVPSVSVLVAPVASRVPLLATESEIEPTAM